MEIEHEAGEGCVCGPRCEPVKRADGSIGWVYVHHSLDGREKHEPRFPNIGQPCGGSQCDGLHYVCDDCGHAHDEWHPPNAYPY